jgi:Domain of unknown function (DUF4105)
MVYHGRLPLSLGDAAEEACGTDKCRRAARSHRWVPVLLPVFDLFCLLIAVLATLWASLALYFDLPLPRFHTVAAVAYLFAVIVISFLPKRFLWRILAPLLCCACVLGWWLSLRPSNQGRWQADVSRTASATVSGNQVTIHNFRDCDYRAELDYTCDWETRTVSLDRIQGVDLFMDYWGSPWIAHTILSFSLGGGEHIAFSIEARKQLGQSFSSIRGFFRQYTLISVVSSERDVVRLRTNYRHGEDLYLFHTKATPAFARALFMDYIVFTNRLHEHPQWYNALTRNCTTEIYTLDALKDRPFDWRILLNGKADQMEYERGDLVTDGLPWKELKQRAFINPAARVANGAPDFSVLIREGRPGFRADSVSP